MISYKKKIGLALSGGAARGLAHIGVLEVLQKEGIPIDMIAGTSAGAIVGAAYASGQSISQMQEFALSTNWKKMAPLVDLSLPKTGLLKGQKIMSLLSTYVGGKPRFSELKIPFACVATDIDTGEEVVIDSGPVLDALRATISVPGIFTVIKYKDRYLVDGGLTTPVPVEVVRRMGSDFIIAVNVNPDVTGRMGKTYRQRVEAHKEPNIVQVIMQSIYITTYAVGQQAMNNADIVIEPDLANIGAGDFNKAPEMVERGREAAQKAVPEIKKKLSRS